MDSDQIPTTPLPQHNALHGKSKKATIIMGLVILLCGIAIGHGATVLMFKGRHSHRRMKDPNKIPEILTGKISKKLGLSSEQTEKVKIIMLEKHKSFMKMHAEFYPKMQVIFKEIKAEIAAVLTPGQQKEWEEKFEEIMPMARKSKDHKMPPPPPPGDNPPPPPGE